MAGSLLTGFAMPSAETIVSPYSLRRRAGAPVSTPLDWDEVDPDLDPLSLDLHTIERRLSGKDPWADFWSSPQALPDLDHASPID